MPKEYINEIVTSSVAQKIKDLRNKEGREIEDLAELTGFSRTVIQTIEKSGNPTISELTEIAFALNIHPKHLLDLKLEIKPRNELSPKRLEKSRITSRINLLIKQKFFAKFKSSKEVLLELSSQFPDSKNMQTKSLSVILARLVKSGQLQKKKSNIRNSNLYKAVRSS